MNNQQSQPKQMQKPVRKIKLVPILIIVIIVALLVSAALTILTPQKDKIVQNDFVINNYNDTKSTFKNISFSGTTINIPEKFKIYQIDPNTSLDLSTKLAEKLINEYQLVARENVENYWQNGAIFLVKNTNDDRYAFNLPFAEQQNGLTIVVDEAIKTCLNFYSKYNINPPLTAQKNQLIYLNNNLEQAETEPEQATSLQIPLTYQLDGYPMFYQNENNYPFLCKVNNNYELTRVVFKSNFYTFTPIKEMDSIAIDQAIKNIKDGKASIIDAQSKIADIIDLSWINEANLYSVSIEYRYDEDLKIAYPFYKFKAKLTNSAGINIEALVITPAVETASKD